jgi:hypothetical protein
MRWNDTRCEMLRTPTIWIDMPKAKLYYQTRPSLPLAFACYERIHREAHTRDYHTDLPTERATHRGGFPTRTRADEQRPTHS